MAKQQWTFARWMGPTLDALRQLGGSGRPQEVSEWIVERLSPDVESLGETLKSGQTRFYNQLHWARQYLVWEGLVDASKHGVWTLTSMGYGTSSYRRQGSRDRSQVVQGSRQEQEGQRQEGLHR